MPDPRVSQNAVEVIDSDPGETAVSQNAVEVVSKDPTAYVTQNAVEVVENPLTTILLTQNSIEMVERVLPPPMNISQLCVEIVGKGLFKRQTVQAFVIT